MRPKSTMVARAPLIHGHADSPSEARMALVAGRKQLEQVDQPGRKSGSSASCLENGADAGNTARGSRVSAAASPRAFA